MAMGKRKSERQGDLWVATTAIAHTPGHPFYQRLNGLLGEHGFETGRVESRCGAVTTGTGSGR